ncbi:hypothetical protein K7I13_07540 [Brucepastera parasyntrophica]|uniref:hypothetical protein n=1 Tax=Brucepastera parasyntrophica TaxID=2880008 RepID=UPI002108EBB7|nr:hypothetical protein [Brucepastera parasyntrophica]ULQ61096.1 hypothetical protein K7I13_07540 [Brucepastera parasyntrophica]
MGRCDVENIVSNDNVVVLTVFYEPEKREYDMIIHLINDTSFWIEEFFFCWPQERTVFITGYPVLRCKDSFFRIIYYFSGGICLLLIFLSVI